MQKIISKTIKIKTPVVPPKIDFIEREIEKHGLEPLRWAIVDIQKVQKENKTENILFLSVSGRKKD